MIITKISQPTFSDLIEQKVDLAICASGYESRSSHLAGKLGKIDCRRVAFGFKENKDAPVRKDNDKKFEEKGFGIIKDIPGKASDDVAEHLQRLLYELNLDCCRILIDISSMTRSWYGGIVRALRAETRLSQITADFVYTPAVFYKASANYPPNEIVAPVRGFSSLSFANKPTLLVLGLGWDEKRAIGLIEELDPKEVVIFHTLPSSDKRFNKAVIKANKDILNSLPQNNIYGYPINDTIATFNIMESVISGLIRDYNVVLASLGPKIFGLCCFLLATKYPEISVWRVSAGSKEPVVDHKPSRNKIILETGWAVSLNEC